MGAAGAAVAALSPDTAYGAIDRTIPNSLYIKGPGPWEDVVAWGAAKDGSNPAATTTAVQNAIDALPSTGGVVFFPPGTYALGDTLVLKPGTTLAGAGQATSILQAVHSGDGVRMTSKLNGSTAVNCRVTDLAILNSTPSTNNGGIVDIGGTFWRIERVTIVGFAYNVIFDQTELADVVGCQLDGAKVGGVWLVNGEDHLGPGSGVKGGFTNRISIQNCQVSPNPAGTGIVDDGGNSHYLIGNNFNGGQRYLRLAGVAVSLLANNEMESAQVEGIRSTNWTSVLHKGAGQLVDFTLMSNEMSCVGPCIVFENGSPVTSIGNLYNSPVTPLQGVRNCYTFSSFGDTCSTPALTDGISTRHLVFGQGGLQTNGPVGFNGSPPVARPTVTGAKGGNTALDSLLTALSSMGLITNSTT